MEKPDETDYEEAMRQLTLAEQAHANACERIRLATDARDAAHDQIVHWSEIIHTLYWPYFRDKNLRDKLKKLEMVGT